MTLEVINLKVKYGDRIILENINLKINRGEIVTIIGPNGSGKSTLIKAVSRCLKPAYGIVNLDEENLYKIPTKTIAKKIAILPQEKSVSSDITLENLVSYGRYPHLKFGKGLSKDDIEIINWAIEITGLKELRNRYVGTLSGGERQRAWISMALAQRPKILILDEPTTYLDISYQLEVLELIKALNKTLGITVIMVLHDLNQAARYSDNIFVLMNGRIYKHGAPEDIIKSKLLKDVFRIDAHIYEDKVNSCPYFISHKII